jgi:hypothetical protein
MEIIAIIPAQLITGSIIVELARPVTLIACNVQAQPPLALIVFLDNIFKALPVWKLATSLMENILSLILALQNVHHVVVLVPIVKVQLLIVPAAKKMSF